ncbi:ZYRO0D04334p [Zygosaccharomyces rouxii]|uniref:Pre-mRNA-processing protein 45 n=1 Tax=Zygosaccharomyces rouxii (strain ATCC 2623 / CBS 732 / NBRC 1130 / NCYC 568 / NRRL Y-229) TaxID=559307 RepID=C5DV69_ZYGRC|nr:uncharacterized protein ZYRO0D04334g [Zygosaccharomyces rouxii]KAH9200602.1 SKIP/SNW domain-containing protein [Zygosaccharomyces rouxii]CAR27688.1 ZYRO0D04334p [Zygosaccharomyces rouxii]
MSFTSLLPAPKHSQSVPEDNFNAEQKNKELAVRALTHQKDEQDIERSVFDSAITNNLKFQDFVPIRQKDFGLQIPLPSQNEIDETYRRTKGIFEQILLKNTQPEAATIRNNQRALENTQEILVHSTGGKSNRKLKVIEHAKDPLQPNAHRAKKVVAPPVDEPMTPIFHKTDSVETAKKVSKEEKDMWKIPPAISSWKNPNGYTIGIDKRLAMDGRYNKDKMQAHEINDGFSQLSAALEMADRKARQELKLKAEAKKQIAEDENREKGEKLRILAQKAREERSRQRNKRSHRAIDDGYNNEATHREAIRKSRREELERDIRKSKMSTADRLRELAYSQGREVSEKVVLGAAKSTNSSGAHYDSRLFTKGANTQAKRGEGQVYDNPLFSQLGSSYRANLNKLDKDVEDEASMSAGQTKPIEFTAATDNNDADKEKEEHKEYGLSKKDDL